MGIFHRITISKCDITKTYKLGISLYTGDGGDLHQVVIRDINMNGVAAPISIRRSSGMHTFHEGNKPRQTPRFFHNVTIRNVNAKNIGIIGILINGISNQPAEFIAPENIQLELPSGGNSQDTKIQLAGKNMHTLNSRCSENPCQPMPYISNTFAALNY